MIIKYLEGDVTVKGLNLPKSAVRCIQVHGDELEGCWTVLFGIYGNIDSVLDAKHYYLDKITMIVMMEGYQRNNLEEKVNIFEYSLLKLKEVDPRFANFELKETSYSVNYTNAPHVEGDVLIDPVLFEFNPHPIEDLNTTTEFTGITQNVPYTLD